MDKKLVIGRVVNSLADAALYWDFAVNWFEKTSAYTPAEVRIARGRAQKWRDEVKSAREALDLG